jgi:tRNA threonylcarbamoyladenosine biosynthesis protein TsaE
MIARELTVAGPGAMRELGASLAAVARAGDLIVLVGPLGAGKTVLVQGIGAALGVGVPVTSPTFVIARVHRDGRVPLVHVDAYRLSSVVEVDDLDLDASLADSLTVVEWGEGLVEGLADSYLRVEIDRPEASGGSAVQTEPDALAEPEAPAEPRQVRLVPVGGDWAQRLGG